MLSSPANTVLGDIATPIHDTLQPPGHGIHYLKKSAKIEPFDAYLLIGWSKSHLSLKGQQDMTIRFNPLAILLKFQFFFFLQCFGNP